MSFKKYWMVPPGNCESLNILEGNYAESITSLSFANIEEVKKEHCQYNFLTLYFTRDS